MHDEPVVWGPVPGVPAQGYDLGGGEPARREVDAATSAAAQRAWWDDAAPGYLAEHRDQLGDDRFVWGPEGLDEADAGLLGDVAGLTVLEIGAGAAQCSRWLAGRGARVVASDLSAGMLREAGRLDRGRSDPVPLMQCDATRLPLADGSVDLVVSSYGALPFLPGGDAVHAEVFRVLVPGGRWVFSLTHPIRWAFPDDPGPGGLTARSSYFDRRPYVELDPDGPDGTVSYVEHHRTLGDRVRELAAAGFVLTDLVEPEWTPGRRTWGGWSALRGELLPGTAIFSCRRPEERRPG